MTDTVIQVESVTKVFGKTTVLDNINLSFQRGQITGLIGRNGSGKTMLLKCIVGFVPATSGKILVNGKVIGKDVDVPPDV